MSVSGEHLGGADFAAAFSKALGEPVEYNEVSPETYRGFGFPGADDIGNMFQFKHDFEDEYRGPRDPAEARKAESRSADVRGLAGREPQPHPDRLALTTGSGSGSRLTPVVAHPMPPKGVGGPGRPPCAGSATGRFHGGVAIIHETAAACRDSRGRPRGDAGGQRHRAGRRDARPGVQRRRRAHRHDAQGLAWRPAACASPRSSRPTAASSSGCERRRDDPGALQRDGTLDTTYGTERLRLRALRGDADQSPGASGATALALDAAGNVLATGFGGSQSMFVARFSPAGRHDLERRLLRAAPDRLHRARARRAPDGSVVIAGQARDRWHGTPYMFYGARAVVQVTRRLGADERLRHLEHSAATRATARLLGRHDRRPHPRRRRAQRQPRRTHYHGVAVRPDGSYVTAAINGAISSFTAAAPSTPASAPAARRRSAPPRCTPCASLPTAASSPAGEGTGAANRGACWSPSSARRGARRGLRHAPGSCACSRARATTRARRSRCSRTAAS